MKKILIIGASSAIAQATARLWSEQGDCFFLVARNEERLKAIASDLKIRGAGAVHATRLDLNDLPCHEALVEQAFEKLGEIDIVLIAHGTLGDQEACELDFKLALNEFNANAISVFSLLTHCANRFEKQGHGTIVVISSVAGERGRQSNYVYGAAKGAVTIFLQGLRHRLYKSGVHVLTVKPGFVDTPMTSTFKKGLLWVKPETIARYIDSGIKKQRAVVYAPWFWFFIMLFIRLIPDYFFKRMQL